MKAEIKKEVQILLVLNRKEAKYLRNLTQNF